MSKSWRKQRIARPARVCRWTEGDLKAYLKTGVLPACSGHWHHTQEEAIEATGVPIRSWLDESGRFYHKVFDARWLHAEVELRDWLPVELRYKVVIENIPLGWRMKQSASVPTEIPYGPQFKTRQLVDIRK